MSRPPRLQAPGAFYHVTSRGNRRALIFLDPYDYATWLAMLGETAERFGFVIHLYCQMPNHFHIVVETPLGNIASGMHFLNGKYFQYFNRKHDLIGHVAQGRYHAELIRRDEHLLECARYLVRNPVRAGLADDARDWKWSNHRALLGIEPVPPWLSADWILSQFGSGEPSVLAYAEFVRQGKDKPNPLRRLRRRQSALEDPARQLPWDEYCAGFPDPLTAALQAYLTSACSIRALAVHLNTSPRTLMRIFQRMKKDDSPPE